MISPERSDLLKSFLGSLPEQIAARLARAVEVDRLIDGKSLPHELILESLRPSLRRINGSDRTPTALRFFCLPFEDLLAVTPRRSAKQKGRISRGSVAPIWTWVSQTLLPRETKLYCRNFKMALVAGNHVDTKSHAEAFWPIAADAMRTALASDAERESARAALGGDLIVADAEEVALLLGVGAAVMKIQQTLVKPVPVLNDELLASLSAIEDELQKIAADAAPYVAVIAMNRLARPWEALKLAPKHLSSSRDATIGAADMGLAGEIIFADIERCADAVRTATQPAFDVDALIENISRFTTLSSGMLKGIGMRGDGTWEACLSREQSALAGIMDTFMERATEELSHALPCGGQAPDEETIGRALSYARLVKGCKPFAIAGAFAASQKQAEQEMSENLRRRSDEVVKTLRQASAKDRLTLERQFEICVRLTAVLASEADAEFLRRRTRVATTHRAQK